MATTTTERTPITSLTTAPCTDYFGRTNVTTTATTVPMSTTHVTSAQTAPAQVTSNQVVGATTTPGKGWWAAAGVSQFLLWFLVITVLTWLILLSFRPEWVLAPAATDLPPVDSVDPARALIASIVIALIVVIIIWLIVAVFAAASRKC
jgi:hypothetical protein